MKISGFRNTDADNPAGVRVYINKIELKPEGSQKVINHSPDGFEWGYGGSGPAQLALAILLKATTKEKAVRYYQDFKNEFIVGLPNDDFELEVDVKGWLEKQEVA